MQSILKANHTPLNKPLGYLMLMVTLMLSLFVGGLTGNAMNTSNSFGVDGSVSIAFPQTYTPQLQQAISNMGEKNQIIPKEGAGGGQPVFSVTNGTVVFNKTEFETGTQRSQRDTLEAFVKQIDSSAVPQSAKRKVMDGVQSSSDNVNKLMIPLLMSESGADMYGAQQVIKGGIPAYKIVIGILAHLIIYGLILSTLLDLAYIGLPFARNFTGNKDGGGGGDKPAWITYDAYSAVKDAESGESYKNPYFKYFIRRSWSYILIAVLITWLVVGELGSVISLFMALGDGFISSE